MCPSTVPKGRNVKSVQATDAHERAKDFLSATEVAKLLDAMKQGRHGIRDHLLALMMFRHGLRVSEAIGIRRNEVDLDHSRLWVRRLKRGLDVEHPIAGDELRAIKRYSAGVWRFPAQGRSRPCRRRLRGSPRFGFCRLTLRRALESLAESLLPRHSFEGQDDPPLGHEDRCSTRGT